MKKYIVVAGRRNFDNYEAAKEYIDFCISKLKHLFTLVFVSGGCKGADKLGKQYALENGYEIMRIPADWKKHGKAAGPKRNMKMAQMADFVICFWDGKSKGTKSMINYTIKSQKPLKIKKISIST